MAGIQYSGGGSQGQGQGQGQGQQHLLPALQIQSQLKTLEIYNIADMIGVGGFPPNSKNDNHPLLWNDNNKTIIQSQGQNQNQNQNQKPPVPLSLALMNSPHSTSTSIMHIRDEEQEGMFSIRNSNYLIPAQDLLNEFCSLCVLKGSDNYDDHAKKKVKEDEDDRNAQSLYTLDALELQRRRTKLLHMLQQVNKRYKHYCHQMRTMLSSLEAVAGSGSADVYTTMASRAMSRHFRCLKDGILGQMKAIKKVLGDKDPGGAPGTTKGETPRLRLLDQSLRQQRAYQQLSIMDSHPWRPQRGLPEKSVNVLRAWLFEHFLNPYPTDVDKHILARQTGLSRSQVSNWFINARVRLWKPMVEEMYLEDQKESHPTGNDVVTPNHHHSHANPIADQKPTHEQLIRIDPVDHHQTLSSIVGEFGSNDFSPYGHHTSSGFGSGVSLTLGLHQHQHQHQHGGLGVDYTTQNAVFYGREEIEDCETTGEYSLMEGENQNLPYRNLMGAQLLQDLAG